MISCSGESGSLSTVGFRLSLDNRDSGLATDVLLKTKNKPSDKSQTGMKEDEHIPDYQSNPL